MLPQPSDFELAILRSLWRRDAATVRQVFEDLVLERPLGYTTVLKTMQIMVDKGLVERDESGRSHIYRTVQREQETQAGMLRTLLDKAFGGSARKLVMAALKTAPMSVEEEAEIRALLQQARQERQP